jgi:ketosteroid isomerase-like protein
MVQLLGYNPKITGICDLYHLSSLYIVFKISNTMKSCKLQLLVLLLGCLSFFATSQEWTLTSKLQPGSLQALDNIGISCAISDTFMISGAWWDNNSETGTPVSSAGAAYLFSKDGTGNWVQKQKLFATSSEALGYFGYAVDIEGNTAIVSSFNEDSADGLLGNVGAVYVFTRNAQGEWNATDKLVAPDAGQADLLGKSIAISGEFIVVGADAHKMNLQGNDPLTAAGAAYVFRRNNNQWSFMQKLIAPDRAEGDRFGKYIDISMDRIIVGADDKDEGFNFEAGAAYIYEYNPALDRWEPAQKLLASDIQAFKQYGWDVAIDGDYAMVGASADLGPTGNFASNAGAVYVYHRDAQGTWTETQKLHTNDFAQNDLFSRAIDLQGDRVVIGAESEDEDANGGNTVFGAGSAYIFENDNGTWIQTGKLIGSERGVNDYFGISVALDYPNIAIGAWNADVMDGTELINDVGAVYVFSGGSVISSTTKNDTPLSGSIFPNPSSGLLHIKTKDHSLVDQISIYNGTGIKVRSYEHSKHHVYHLHDLPNGMYCVRLEGKEYSSSTVLWVKTD